MTAGWLDGFMKNLKDILDDMANGNARPTNLQGLSAASRPTQLAGLNAESPFERKIQERLDIAIQTLQKVIASINRMNLGAG